MKNAKSKADKSKFILSERWKINIELKIENTKNDNEIKMKDKLKNLYLGSFVNLYALKLIKAIRIVTRVNTSAKITSIPQNHVGPFKTKIPISTSIKSNYL